MSAPFISTSEIAEVGRLPNGRRLQLGGCGHCGKTVYWPGNIIERKTKPNEVVCDPCEARHRRTA